MSTFSGTIKEFFEWTEDHKQLFCDKTEEIDGENITFSMTMNVKEWREVKDQLRKVLPGSKLEMAVDEFVYKAEATLKKTA